VSKWGTYYPKTYANWRKEAKALLAEHEANYMPWECPVFVMVTSSVKRPAKPSNHFPHPDVDNYAKAALDAVQGCGYLIKDDKQVQVLLSSKRFVQPGEQPHTYVVLADSIENLGSALYGFEKIGGQDVFDLPDEFLVPLHLLEDE
jgi:Holliday junction resolvase RusA-like endonuclease